MATISAAAPDLSAIASLGSVPFGDEPKETDMPSPSLIAAFDAAQQRHAEAVAALVPLLIEMALTTVAEALPGATVLETEGEMNEDWLFTLRIQRVLGTDGAVLYDIGIGHDDPEVETRIDEVGFEYLDLLLDLTGDDYLGRKTVSWPIGAGP